MKKNLPFGEILDLVACDIGARPIGAPAYDALAPHIRGVERSAATLRISFAPEAADDVEAFAAAERLCCSSLGFDVDRDPLALTISASPAQLDAMEQLFHSA